MNIPPNHRTSSASRPLGWGRILFLATGLVFALMEVRLLVSWIAAAWRNRRRY